MKRKEINNMFEEAVKTMESFDSRLDALEARVNNFAMELIRGKRYDNSERELYSRKEVLETLTDEELDLIGKIYFDWMSYYPREKEEGDFYPFVIEWSENNEDGSLSFHRACISNRELLEHSSLANALSEVLSHLSEESDGVDD